MTWEVSRPGAPIADKIVVYVGLLIVGSMRAVEPLLPSTREPMVELASLI